MQSQICPIHNQQVEFIERKDQTTFLCRDCLIEKNNVLIPIDMEKKNLQSLKENLINEKKILNDANIDLLQKLKSQLRELQIQLSSSIEKYLETFDQQMTIISESEIKFKDMIELDDENTDKFIHRYQELEKQFLNYQDIKELLLKHIVTLSIEQFIIKIKEILKQIQTGFKSYENETINALKSKFQGQLLNFKITNLNCEEHNEEKILMIDLNEINKIPKRLACLDCLNKYPNQQLTKLKNFQELLMSNQSLKFNYVQNKAEELQKKALEITDHLTQVKNNLISQIQLVSNKTNSSQLLQVRQIKFCKEIYSQDYSQFKYEDFVNIANQLSNPNNIEQFQGYINNECSKWYEQTNSYLFELEATLTKTGAEIGKLKNQQKQIKINSELTQQQLIKPSLLSQNFWSKLIVHFKQKTKQNISKSILVYKGSRDGLSGFSFWNEVQNKSKLLMIFKSKTEYVFGSYTPIKWKKVKYETVPDKTCTSFLFSQNNNQIYDLKPEQKDKAVFCSTDYGPTFGYNGNDFTIETDFQNGYSKLGCAYQFDLNKDGDNQTVLFGQVKPEIVECEIYQLIFT